MDLLTRTDASSETLEACHAGHDDGSSPPDWRAMNASDHFVQFYESDPSLVDAVSGFIGAGLEAGDYCIVIGTRPHREDIEVKLQIQGLDVAAMRMRGQYVTLDAAEALTTFMVEGAPEPERFAETVGRVVAHAAQEGKRVRAFGEMVALLLSAGNHAGAVRLEQLWNELAQSHSFALFCAYSMDSFGCEAHAIPFTEICRHHSRVIPAESYAALDSPDARTREISRLQQKAIALEAEIARREELERDLYDFFENAVEGIHKVGPDGIILWANKAELALLGYQPEEYIGRHIAEFHMDREVIEAMLAKLLDGEPLYDWPARLQCKDGSIKQVLVHSNACFKDGKFLYTRCFTRDVTERKLAESFQQRLAAIVDSADDAIVGKTLEGIITSWNRGAEHIFGYTAEEAIGKPKTLVFPLDRLEEETEILARLRRGEHIEHFETVRQRKDGTQIDISLTISPIQDSQGTIVGASTIARDITDAKQQQRELAVLNARLKRSMTETHHRVKNNLQLVSALIDMQKATYRETIPMSELVRLGSNVRALGVIHDILTQEAKEGAEEDTLSAKTVLDELLSLLQQAAGERRLTFACEDVRLSGRQATSLALLANELVSNALKHGKHAAEIYFTVHAGEATLEVRDDGPGFPEGFHSLRAAHTGLELVENVAKWDMAGKTDYESMPQGGGRVTVSFPIANL
ncbi:MAG: response regulator [Chthonomonadaceae bacterium]|nr:response regulator [Chthonomonadaceae bacterium]